MRLVSYFGPEGLRPGIQRPDGEVVDTQSLAFSLGLPSEVVVRMDSNRRVLALSQPALAELDRAATDGRQLPASVAILPADVRLGPPVPDPQKIICVGLNYRDHAEEVGAKPPPSPMYFAKFANSLAGPSADLVPPRATSKVVYEAELAVIGDALTANGDVLLYGCEVADGPQGMAFLQAIADANVVLLLLDATQGVTDQDAHIAGYHAGFEHCLFFPGRSILNQIIGVPGDRIHQRPRLAPWTESQIDAIQKTWRDIFSQSVNRQPRHALDDC